MSKKTLGPSPGARRSPDHRVDVSRHAGRVVATLGGQIIADSEGTLALDEAGYGRVFYFPAEDVRVDRLQESATRTSCPFKGEARYYAADIDGDRIDVAWYYPRVYDEVAPIAGRIAFYADRVAVEDRG